VVLHQMMAVLVLQSDLSGLASAISGQSLQDETSAACLTKQSRLVLPGMQQAAVAS
jgi:hypothetical protein